jgi:DNA-binding transcriptional regulator GbsR (MarR family)
MTAEPIDERKPRTPQTATPDHVDRFIEQLGRLAEGEGLPRTAGRMLALLILAGAPLGIDDFARRLKVSRASVSTNSRLLQSLAIAELVGDLGSRRDYLQISGDPSSALLTLGLQRMHSMRQAIRQMRLALRGARLSATRARLQQMEKFYDAATAQVQAVLRKWRASEAAIARLAGINVGAASATRRKSAPRIGSRRAQNL